MNYCFIPSPLGNLLLAGDDTGIRHFGVQAGKKRRDPESGWQLDEDAFRPERAQVAAYFAGTLKTFDMRLAPQGTPFQMTVWRVLGDIPYAQTISYGELARRIGRPSAARAVGAANGANPLAIVVPCHRVIGADGSLVGYGGGLANKQALLAHERRYR